MVLLGLYMGKVTRVWKKLVGSAVFLKLVRPLVVSNPACTEKCVRLKKALGLVVTKAEFNV